MSLLQACARSLRLRIDAGDGRLEFAFMEAQRERIPCGGVARSAERASILGCDCVAPGENVERRKRLKVRGQLAELCTCSSDPEVRCGEQARPERAELRPRMLHDGTRMAHRE